VVNCRAHHGGTIEFEQSPTHTNSEDMSNIMHQDISDCSNVRFENLGYNTRYHRLTLKTFAYDPLREAPLPAHAGNQHHHDANHHRRLAELALHRISKRTFSCVTILCVRYLPLFLPLNYCIQSLSTLFCENKSIYVT
jgi:hypothetical protein